MEKNVPEECVAESGWLNRSVLRATRSTRPISIVYWFNPRSLLDLVRHLCGTWREERRR